MSSVHTAYGPGKIVQEDCVRGRKSYRVEGPGFNVWVDAKDIRIAADIDHINEGNETDLPYDPSPQFPVEMFNTESTIQPNHHLDADERLSPAKSRSFDKGKDRPYPGPNPDLFAKEAGYADEHPDEFPYARLAPGEDPHPGRHFPKVHPDRAHLEHAEHASEDDPFYGVYGTENQHYAAGGRWDQQTTHNFGTGLPGSGTTSLSTNADQQSVIRPVGYSAHKPMTTQSQVPMSAPVQKPASRRLARGDYPPEYDYDDEDHTPEEIAADEKRNREEEDALYQQYLEDQDPGWSPEDYAVYDDENYEPSYGQDYDDIDPDYEGPLVGSSEPWQGFGDQGHPQASDVPWSERSRIRNAGLSNKYIEIQADVDHWSPIQQFRDDPVSFIERHAYLNSSANGTEVDIRLAEYAELVENDPHIREAAWKDVRAKAVRLRREGRVHVKDISPDRIYATVDGDSGTYETLIYKGGALGDSITSYSCTCPWGQTVSQRKMLYVGRLCAHGAACLYEMQSRQMKQINREHPYKKKGSVDGFKSWAEDDNDGHIDHPAADTYIGQENMKAPSEHLSEEEVAALYDFVDGHETQAPERKFDVEYTNDPDKVYKEGADVLHSRPRSLSPDFLFHDDEDTQSWTNVEKDERETTGPDQILHGSNRYADTESGVESPDPYRDFDGGGKLLDKLRGLIEDSPTDDLQHMDRRNDEIRDVVDELHEKGFDANNLVAHLIRQAADVDTINKHFLSEPFVGSGPAPKTEWETSESYVDEHERSHHQDDWRDADGDILKYTKPSQGPRQSRRLTAEEREAYRYIYGDWGLQDPATGTNINAIPGATPPPPPAPSPGTLSGPAQDAVNAYVYGPGGSPGGGGAPTPTPAVPGSSAPKPGSTGPGSTGNQTYTVQEGDTLSGIAQSHGLGGNYKDIAKSTGGDIEKNPDLIHPGDVITLPGGNSTQHGWGGGPNPTGSDLKPAGAGGDSKPSGGWFGTPKPSTSGPSTPNKSQVGGGAGKGLFGSKARQLSSGRWIWAAGENSPENTDPALNNPPAPSDGGYDWNTDTTNPKNHKGPERQQNQVLQAPNPSGVPATPPTGPQGTGKVGPVLPGGVDPVTGVQVPYANSNNNANLAVQTNPSTPSTTPTPPGTGQPHPGGAYGGGGNGVNMGEIGSLISGIGGMIPGVGGIARGFGNLVSDIGSLSKGFGGAGGGKGLGQFKASHEYRDDGDGSDIVAAFHRQGGIEAINSSGGGSYSDAAIAEQAQGFLRTAGRNYSFAEQRELEDEEHHLGARNLDRLDLSGTHYEDS